MTRVVSVWLPRWPILRFLMAQKRNPSLEPVDPQKPFVLAVDAAGGPRIVAANAAAASDGLSAGHLVADARAKVDNLQVRSVDPAADALALRRLALWATRYTPATAPWKEENGADGLFLDITGASHLFGGERELLVDMRKRLEVFGLHPRIAVAGTPGAAWALAHYGGAPMTALEPEQEVSAIAPLPVEALRLSSATRTTLRRLGFKKIGALIANPRAPFASRFPAELLTRLDQALGRLPEPIDWLAPPPRYRIHRQLVEPITTQEAILSGAKKLMENLFPDLERDGVGARALEIWLYRTDGEAITVDVALSMPTRSVAHVMRLFDLRLERLSGTLDVGFGFDTMALSVPLAERLDAKQSQLVANSGPSETELCGALIDKLKQKLGASAVRRPKPVDSHLPERAEALTAAGTSPAPWPSPDDCPPRPVLLLPRPEPAEVISSVPEGPPRRLKWRRSVHAVVASDGPERLTSEWWRQGKPQPHRDYYVVEDNAGRRFWIYREGPSHSVEGAPRWFVHGLFA